MSEPTIPPPPPAAPPRPFSGEPKPLAGGGCGRPLLVGCGILVVLLGIAAIVFVAKAKDLLAWTMRELEEQVVASLPEEVTAEERARLDRGFERSLERIYAGEVEPPALYALQRQLMNAAEKSQAKTLTRDDVLDLLSALERVGGLLPEDDEADDGATSGDAGPVAPDSP
jgi:hypothetical protein